MLCTHEGRIKLGERCTYLVQVGSKLENCVDGLYIGMYIAGSRLNPFHALYIRKGMQYLNYMKKIIFFFLRI